MMRALQHASSSPMVWQSDNENLKLYDASANMRHGDRTLNEVMFRGSVLLLDLMGVLLRLRTMKTAVLANV